MSDPEDRELERRIRGLPRSVDPERDLWTEIAARIGAKRRPASLFGRVPRRTTAALVAAVGALSVAAATVVVLRRHHAVPNVAIENRPADSSAASSPLPSTPEVAPRDEVYVVALRQLEASFAEQRRRLPSDAVQRIETSLAVLDEAIGDTKKALESQPGSTELEGQLRNEYEQKIRALTDLVDLATGAS
jgi:hypothetical protein